MPKKSLDLLSVFRLGIVVLIVAVRLVFEQDWIGNLLLVLGWGIGYFLAEADHLFYVAVCNPQELSCQRIKREIEVKNWRNAWGIMQSTKGERNKLPVHNIVTSLVVSFLGIWLVTSSSSLLATGVVVGLGVRLFSEFATQSNYQSWYWLFAREFTPNENKTLKIVWGGLLLLQILLLVRG